MSFDSLSQQQSVTYVIQVICSFKVFSVEYFVTAGKKYAALISSSLEDTFPLTTHLIEMLLVREFFHCTTPNRQHQHHLEVVELAPQYCYLVQISRATGP